VSVAARPLLSVNNIEVIYDHVILVLKACRLQVPRRASSPSSGAKRSGQVHHVKAISGLLRTERGEVTKGGVELGGEVIHRREASEIVRRGVVQVMEGGNVFEHLTVEDICWPAVNTTNGPALRRISSGCTCYFPRLRTGAPSGPATSGGEQQMLAIGGPSWLIPA